MLRAALTPTAARVIARILEASGDGAFVAAAKACAAEE